MKPYSIQDWGKYLKRKMMISRIMGILGCLIGVACIIIFALQKAKVMNVLINDWMCLITLTYSMALAFTLNSGLQGVKVGNPWQRVNAICAVFFYLFVVFLISYGFASGNLQVKF